MQTFVTVPTSGTVPSTPTQTSVPVARGGSAPKFDVDGTGVPATPSTEMRIVPEMRVTTTMWGTPSFRTTKLTALSTTPVSSLVATLIQKALAGEPVGGSPTWMFQKGAEELHALN